MKTSYFSFGQDHVHRINGNTLDVDCLIKIESENPIQIMFALCGGKWSFEYKEKPDMLYFPAGVYNYNTNERELI